MTLSPSRSFKAFPGSSDENAKPAKGTAVLQWALGIGKSTASKAAILLVIVATSAIIYTRLSSSIETTSPFSKASNRNGKGDGGGDGGDSANSIWSALSSQTELKTAVAAVAELDGSVLTKGWLASQSLLQRNLPPTPLNNTFDSYGFDVNIWDIYPPTLNCPDMQRVGKVGEGGKWVCALHHLESLPSCVMYSFGISTDISFEIEILLRTKCKIFAFDPTVGALPFHQLPARLNRSLTPAMKERIVFNKVALAGTSGFSSAHSLNEQFYDIMVRYNHSFVNLLKVDVEGAEWDVFSQLHVSPFTRQHHSFPVGQLLIELHHQTAEKTSRFFQIMHAVGLYPFSREINLNPCISGDKPFAAEYSFLHAQHYFQAQATFRAPPPPTTPTWHDPIEAVVYYLTQHKRLQFMASALQNLYAQFWKFFPHFPVIVFHDDLTSDDITKLRSSVPSMPLRFVRLAFSIPQALVDRKVVIPERTVCDPQHSTLGYRHMCHFHAFDVHDQLARLNISYEYILRLDDDSSFSSPIGYDLFRFMKENQRLYGFVNTVEDAANCVTRLWEHSRSFAMRPNLTLANDSFLSQWPDPIVFYNNFEISHRSLWSHAVWREYRSFIEDLGGIYTLRWGDAPLHTIGVSMILNTQQVHAFTDIAYRHLPFVDQTPRGLPKPHAHPFGIERECTFYDRWICPTTNESSPSSLSSPWGLTFNHSWNASHNGTTWSRLQLSFADPKQVWRSTQQEEYSLRAKMERGVLFTFAHGGREESLMASIQSFFTNYASLFPTTFVIFYNQHGSFDVKRIAQVFTTKTVHPVIRFQPVPLANLSGVELDRHCAVHESELHASSLFLRRKVYDVLAGMGFEWFFRFADASTLHSPVPYNLFVRMHTERKVYAYHRTLNGEQTCIQPVWKLAQDICTALQQDSLVTGGLPQKCSTMFQPVFGLFTTSLEISHISVWRSALADLFFEAMGDDLLPSPVLEASNSSSSHGRSGAEREEQQTRMHYLSRYPHLSLASNRSLNWVDSIAHTVVVLMSLQPSQILQLEGLDYSFQWNTGLTSSQGDRRMHLEDYSSSSLTALDDLFSPQRIGWLGGDVATSVLLPPRRAGQTSKELVWLFGDSLLGVSTPKKRIAEHSAMVSNTIGLSVLNNQGSDSPSALIRPVRSLKYYWRLDSNGSPAPIFQLTNQSVCHHRKASLWPLAGIAITGSASSSQEVSLVVLCQIACLGGEERKPDSGDRLPEDGLSFETEDTAVIVVHNPLDPPDVWEYDQLVLPRPAAGQFRWMAMSEASGQSIASVQDTLYLLGSYQPHIHGQMSLLQGYQVLGRIPAASLLRLDLSQLYIAMEKEEEKEKRAEEVRETREPLWAPLYSSPHLLPTVSKKTTTKVAALHPKKLFAPMLSEASLFYDRSSQSWKAMSLHVAERHVQLCQSKTIADDWTCAYVLEIPAQWQHPRLTSYAAKAHPELLGRGGGGREGEERWRMVVSMVSNMAHDPQQLFEEENRWVYTPKFVLLEEKKKEKKQQ